MEIAAGRPRVLLVRHGETEWSRAMRHTGLTDLALTDAGRIQAMTLEPGFATSPPDAVWCSPLLRARETARLAGFANPKIDERLVEWDYGEAEGKTTEEMRAADPSWSVWTSPTPGAERIEDVATRADAVVADLKATTGTTLVVAHGHILRFIAARWCELSPIAARHFVVGVASLCELGWERETPAIVGWNRPPEPAHLT